MTIGLGLDADLYPIVTVKGTDSDGNTSDFSGACSAGVAVNKDHKTIISIVLDVRPLLSFSELAFEQSSASEYFGVKESLGWSALQAELATDGQSFDGVAYKFEEKAVQQQGAKYGTLL